MTPKPGSRLEGFLASGAVASRAMDLHMVRGLACALVLGPRPVSPAVWMGWVWDREQGWRAPEFADLDEANAVMTAQMAVHNEVATALGPAAGASERFEPGFVGAGPQTVASF
jgi:yecA family protein